MRLDYVASVLVLPLALSGCVKYHPKPVDPARAEAELRARKLPPGEIRWEELVEYALRWNPEIAVAEARARVAEAAVTAARPRPNPSISTGGGNTNSPESPLVFRFAPAILVETARKRDYRILEAAQLAEAARIQAEEARWLVRSRTRDALSNYYSAVESRDGWAAEVSARRHAVELLERRVLAGETARPDLDAAQAELLEAEASLRQAEGAVSAALASLSAALGVTPEGLHGCRPLLWTPAASAETVDALAAGLLHRFDVRRSLVEYAAAEARLRLEIAQQYPDVQLGPDYSFDEGHYKITGGVSLALPLFHRNRGPIAEAEARRSAAEARFRLVQSGAVAEMELARARLQAAVRELEVVRKEADVLRRQREAVSKAVAVGELDRYAETAVAIRAAAAERLAAEARARWRRAFGEWEDALQTPLLSR